MGLYAGGGFCDDAPFAELPLVGIVSSCGYGAMTGMFCIASLDMEESELKVPRLDDIPRFRVRLDPDVSCLDGESLPLATDVVRGGGGGP